MRVLVLGATGGTGREIVREAAGQGHSVVALVRSKARAQSLVGAELVEGDARDEAVVGRAVEGCSGVVSSLGTSVSPFREVTLLSTATRVLVDVMARQNVRRLVCITGLGAGDSRGHGGFVFDRLIFPLLLRKVYADKDRQEEIVRSSGTDWVLVRPTVLNDGPARGSVQAMTDLSGLRGGTIARADAARFVVAQLTDGQWLHRAPLITW
jgi:uncharacterized protein YbjT (DUF2867 family)